MRLYEVYKTYLLDEMREIIELGDNVGHVHAGEAWNMYLTVSKLSWGNEAPEVSRI